MFPIGFLVYCTLNAMYFKNMYFSSVEKKGKNLDTTYCKDSLSFIYVLSCSAVHYVVLCELNIFIEP